MGAGEARASRSLEGQLGCRQPVLSHFAQGVGSEEGVVGSKRKRRFLDGVMSSGHSTALSWGALRPQEWGAIPLSLWSLVIPASCDSVLALRPHGQVHTHKTVLLLNDRAGCDSGGPRGPVHTERGKAWCQRLSLHRRTSPALTQFSYILCFTFKMDEFTF